MAKKESTISKSADGKTWVMPATKPKSEKKVAGKEKAATKTTVETKKAGKRTPALAAYANRPAELVATYKGNTHKATINEDGTITVNDKTFNSPSRAGKDITGREVDGWSFWSYEVPGEGRKKLDTLRKSAT